MRKYWYRRILILIFIFTVAAGGIYYGPQLWNANRNQEVSVDHFGEDTVLLGGMPVGIYMETKGVMVLDTETVDALDGGSYAPAENLVKPGDYIIEMKCCCNQADALPGHLAGLFLLTVCKLPRLRQ